MVNPVRSDEGRGVVLSIERRMIWALPFLEGIINYHKSQYTRERAKIVQAILLHGAEKHSGKPHRGAFEDIQHAGIHLMRRLEGETKEPESGLDHELHAAADCLLAFGDLMGLVK
jgi:hypothetical protein